MKKIKLTQDAYICSGEYRLHTDDGKPSIAVLSAWYEAMAEDAEGNEYLVVWAVKQGFDAATNPDESDACDWDNPEEIMRQDTGENVTGSVEIEW